MGTCIIIPIIEHHHQSPITLLLLQGGYNNAYREIVMPAVQNIVCSSRMLCLGQQRHALRSVSLLSLYRSSKSSNHAELVNG